MAANEWITGFRYLPKIFFSSVWSFLETGSEPSYYRPMMYVFYIVGYKLSGLETWGYHLIKIALHAANSVMVFFVAARLFSVRSPGGRADDQYGMHASLAFFAAMIFASHPVNTESVAWVAAVPELSFTLFLLLGFYRYSKDRVYSAALFFLLALLSKETALVFPIIVVLFDLFVRRGAHERDIPGGWPARYLPLAVALGLYIILRFVALRGVAPQEGVAGALTGYDYLINALPNLWLYIKVIIYPAKLVFYAHSYDIVSSVLAVRSLLAIALSLITLALLVSFSRTRPLIFFSLLWILIPLLPVLYAGWAKGYPIYAERYIYLSIVGFSMLLAFAAHEAFLYFRLRRSAAVVVALFFIVLSIIFAHATVTRNTAWKSSFNLWGDTALKEPDNVDALINYGNELAKRDRDDEALGSYDRALALDPNRSSTHNGLGIIYAKKGLIDEAVGEFTLALKLEPESADIKRNLERALRLQGEDSRR